LGPETVLVVDDLEVNRRLFGTWLRAAGFEVAEAASGGQALERLAASVPDLVVLDVHLPDLNGREVCQRIKADPALRGVPVLQTSASATLGDDRIEAIEGGADAYLNIPVPAGAFLAVARSLLRLRSAEAETRAAHERWELAFRDASIGMLLVDGQSERALRANRAFAAQLGRTLEQMAGLDWHEVVHPDDQPAAGW
jgi:CheY-like chemotaxis protein